MLRINILLLFTVFSSPLFGRAISLEEAKVRNPEVKRLIEFSDGDEKEWVDLLLQYMPTIDLVTLKADSLLLDLKALHSNLDSLPWVKEIPQEFFDHYVLPYRVSQEPLEYFRLHYGRELFERVRDCSDLKSAVLSVNEWAYEQMKYEPTSRWDQSAGQTIRRGIGRCEEMAILFIKACRSVGIPTRMVSSPWWPFTNSNHAWVEVWTQDGWHFLGGAEMTALDNTWFRKAVRRTAIIKGVTWGEFTKSEKMVYYKGDEYTVLNLTSNYSDTTGLSISVMDTDGAPVESADVWISVFNYSSLRSVAHKYTDKSGKTHLVVGKCDLFISCGKDSLWDYDILRFSEGNTTSNISLVIEKTSIPDTSFWLRVKDKDDIPGDTTYKPPELSYVIHDLHQERLTAVDPEILKELPDTSLEYRLLKNLSRSRGNRETLMNFWRNYEDEPELLLSLWDVMHTKDLVAVDSSTMQKIIDLSKDRREYFDNYDYQDSLFFKYVANPRTLWEDFTRISTTIENPFLELAGKQPNEIANYVVKYIQKEIDTLSDKNYFGGKMNPYQTLAAETGSSIERLTLYVEAMRSVGIPARIYWNYKSAEYYDDNWVSVKFDTTEEIETQETVIAARFIQNDVTRTDVRYYYDFSICQIEDGVFKDITPPMDTSMGIVSFTVPTGEYCFITGFRQAKGDVFVRANPVKTEEDTVKITVELGFPPIEMITSFDLLIRDFQGLTDVDIKDTDGIVLSQSDWQKGNIIIAFLDPEKESSISTAKRLTVINDIPFLIFIKTDKRDNALHFCVKNKLEGRIFYGDEEKLKEILKFHELPSILFLRDGKAILWTEGLNLEISNMIKKIQCF